jgi:hypothetical protein
MDSAGGPPAVVCDSPTTPACPGEVVGAEAEEIGGVRDLVGGECIARDSFLFESDERKKPRSARRSVARLCFQGFEREGVTAKQEETRDLLT